MAIFNWSHKAKYYLGIDVGGTKTKIVLIDDENKIVAETTEPTAKNQGEEEIVAQIIALIKNLSEKNHLEIATNIAGIGLGVPGLINRRKGLVIKTPNLPWQNFDLLTPLQKEFPQNNFFLGNDADAMTWAEYQLGAGYGRHNFICLAIGTGIGGGAIINDHLYLGYSGNALEIGHMILDPNCADQKTNCFIPPCGCGQKGCFESLASGKAIENQTGMAAQKVFQLARSGDQNAQQVINQTLRYLGWGISNLVTIFDPEVVILGGGLAQEGDLVITTVQSLVAQNSFLKNLRTPPIITAQLQQNAGAIGIALLAKKNLAPTQTTKKSQPKKLIK